MKKSAFIFSPSSLFHVCSQLALRPYYACEVFHLKYANESMTPDDFACQQIKELFESAYHSDGFHKRRHLYSFSSRLASRLYAAFAEQSPHIVFFEMKTMHQPEWDALAHIRHCYSGPIAVFVPPEHQNDETIYRLLGAGVKEISCGFDDGSFVRIASRHTQSRSQ